MRIKHAAKQIITQIVVRLANLPGPPARLRICEPCKCDAKEIGKTGGALFVQPGAEQLVKKNIKLFAIPPAIHVTFAQAERPLL